MKTQERSKERLEVLDRIRKLENAGGDRYFVDVENDPPGHPLTPDEVDYLQQKWTSKISTRVARLVAVVAQKKYRRDLQMKVVGEENLAALRGGAILTCNHFSIYDSLAVKEVADRIPGRHRLYKVVKGANFFLPGMPGFLMRHCDTFPLSTNFKTTKLLSEAMETVLGRGDLVLIYPEQAMWWNYRKPRPTKPGAFFYAAKFHVPIVPIFVTMHDQDVLDQYGFPKQAYTIHVMPPIYPDENKTLRDNEVSMQEQNRTLCREKYREVYGKEC